METGCYCKIFAIFENVKTGFQVKSTSLFKEEERGLCK